MAFQLFEEPFGQFCCLKREASLTRATRRRFNEKRPSTMGLIYQPCAAVRTVKVKG